MLGVGLRHEGRVCLEGNGEGGRMNLQSAESVEKDLHDDGVNDRKIPDIHVRENCFRLLDRPPANNYPNELYRIEHRSYRDR